VAEIGGDALGIGSVVEVQRRDERGHLDQEGERLRDDYPAARSHGTSVLGFRLTEECELLGVKRSVYVIENKK
jgi:hypothetical protein